MPQDTSPAAAHAQTAERLRRSCKKPAFLRLLRAELAGGTSPEKKESECSSAGLGMRGEAAGVVLGRIQPVPMSRHVAALQKALCDRDQWAEKKAERRSAPSSRPG
ncbi:hypothetical protein DIPPA_15578 [Diplonema papillatum]|nr:hypothetical protein DIPPA_15578 [Diplonema papillatum]